ncbi:MAG: hypothetical protein K2O18_10930, partial [Oscillospiraceae bacterium]|nr:hypothetical protein [Oscillospiraceae bacterium]
PLRYAGLCSETTLRIYVARAQIYEGHLKDVSETLGTLDYDTMDEEQTASLTETLLLLHSLSEADTAPLLHTFWREISKPVPSTEEANRRRTGLLSKASIWFTPDWIAGEEARMAGEAVREPDGFWPGEWAAISRRRIFRHGYTLFKPLLGVSALGASAAILDTLDTQRMTDIIDGLENVEELSIHALAHALLCGMKFPLQNHPLNIEQMDALADRLTESGETIFALTAMMESVSAEDVQALSWVRGLTLAAVRSCKWDDPERGMALIRLFVEIERVFIPLCYSEEALLEERIFMLPSIHRFGWYCVQAFQALDHRNTAKYVHLLRKGLILCENMRPVAEFLMEYTPELRVTKPSDELLILAEKVRITLMAFSPDDPAVKNLKSSPAYQAVSYLLEERDFRTSGG